MVKGQHTVHCENFKHLFASKSTGPAYTHYTDKDIYRLRVTVPRALKVKKFFFFIELIKITPPYASLALIMEVTSTKLVIGKIFLIQLCTVPWLYEEKMPPKKTGKRSFFPI